MEGVEAGRVWGLGGCGGLEGVDMGGWGHGKVETWDGVDMGGCGHGRV